MHEHKPHVKDIITAHYWLRPFTCVECGAILKFSRGEHEYQAKGKLRVLVGGSYKEQLCNHCLAKRIQRWFKTPRKELKQWHQYDRKRGKCYACEKNKIVATTFVEEWLDLRFGGQWWNGHWICKDCLIECVLKGKQRSGWSGTIRGKYVQFNEVGAMIPHD